MQRYLRFLECVIDYRQRPVPMMLCRISREETLARWGYVGVSDVRHHCGSAVRVMSDDACAQLVRRALETKGDVWPLYPLEINGLQPEDI